MKNNQVQYTVSEEDRNRFLYYDAPLPFQSLDKDAKLVDVNPAWLKLMGYSYEEVIGKDLTFFLEPSTRDLFTLEFKKIKSSNTFPLINYHLITKQRERLLVECRGNIIFDSENKFKHTFCILIDKTEIILSENALKENLEYSKLLFDHSPDGLFLSDLKGVFIDGNSAAEKIIGYKKAELLGKSFLKINLMPLHQIPKAIKQIRDLVAKKHSGPNELILKRKDGKQIVIEAHAHLVKIKGENYILGSVRDITARKKAEEELKITNKKLVALSRHKDIIREEERKKIALDLHDDLAQKLTAINMNLSWLQKNIQTDKVKVKETLKDLLDQVRDASVSVQKTAMDLQPSILTDLGLRDAVIRQLNDFKHNTNIICQIEIGVFEHEPDSETSHHIFRIIQESLTNIIRHANATVIDFRIFITKKICLTIKDNGDGIKKEVIESIKSFGLNGIQERAKLCGGKARITSKIGLGTKIIVNLPLT